MRILKTIITAVLAITAMSASAQLDVVRFTVQDGVSDAALNSGIEKSPSALRSALNSPVISGL